MAKPSKQGPLRLTVGASGHDVVSAPTRQRLRISVGDRTTYLLGSDVRIADSFGRCRLCLIHKHLQLSHVAPRWTFAWMKAEGGVHGSVSRLGIEYVAQDGRKHYLLCRSCEQLLGDAEAYLAKLCRGRPEHLAQIGVTLTYPCGLNNLNVNKVLLALVGIALKAHLAPSPPFTLFHLPKRLFHRLRRQVLTGTLNPNEVALLRAWKWMGGYIPGANPKALLYPSLRAGRNGSHMFDLEMGEWQFTLIIGDIDRVSQSLPRWLRPWPTDTPWVKTPVVDMTENHRISGGEDWFPRPRSGDRWAGVELDRPCPCGLFDQTFQACCRHTWCYRTNS